MNVQTMFSCTMHCDTDRSGKRKGVKLSPVRLFPVRTLK